MREAKEEKLSGCSHHGRENWEANHGRQGFIHWKERCENVAVLLVEGGVSKRESIYDQVEHLGMQKAWTEKGLGGNADGNGALKASEVR